MILRETWLLLRLGTLLGAVALLAVLLPPCLTGAACDRKELLGGLLAAVLFAALGMVTPSATFHFDPRARILRWSRRRLFTTAGGQVPFADIQGVILQASPSAGDEGRAPRTEYQPLLATVGGPLPLSVTHSLSAADYATLEQAIAAVLKQG